MRTHRRVEIPDRGYHRIRAFQGAFGLEKGAVPAINLYDAIGEGGISARDVRRMLDGITAPVVRVRIDSPGGDVFDGLAIFNDLSRTPRTSRLRSSDSRLPQLPSSPWRAIQSRLPQRLSS